MWDLLAENVYVKAVANVGALIALSATLWFTGKWFWDFCRSAYKTNIKAAIKRIKRQRINAAKKCAADFHVYFTFVLSKLIVIFTATLMVFISVTFASKPYEPTSLDLLVGYDETVWRKFRNIYSITSIIFMVVLGFHVFGLLNLLRLVLRLRGKLIKRVRAMRRRESTVGSA